MHGNVSTHFKSSSLCYLVNSVWANDKLKWEHLPLEQNKTSFADTKYTRASVVLGYTSWKTLINFNVQLIQRQN